MGVTAFAMAANLAYEACNRQLDLKCENGHQWGELSDICLMGADAGIGKSKTKVKQFFNQKSVSEGVEAIKNSDLNEEEVLDIMTNRAHLEPDRQEGAVRCEYCDVVVWELDV